MDYDFEARTVLYEHTNAVMSSCVTEFKSNLDMLDYTANECAYILTERLLEGKYTPMQYNAIRNKLAKLLWDVFDPYIEKETQEEVNNFVKLFSI